MILLVSPHPLFTKTAMELRHKHKAPMKVINAFLDDAPSAVEQYLAKSTGDEIHIIVSRGATADVLKGHVRIPLVSADIMGFDLFKAICEARVHSKVIGYLGYKDDPSSYEFSLVSSALEVSLRTYFYSSLNEIRLKMQNAKQDGINVMIVGSKIGEEIAKELGIIPILNQTSKWVMQEALTRAEEIMRAMSTEREVVSNLKSVMNLSSEGLVFVNHDQCIAYANLAAENILKLKREKMIGKPILESALKEIVEGMDSMSKAVTERIMLIYQQDLIVNCLPIIEYGKWQGMVINFTSIKSIQKTEVYVRRNLSQQGLEAQYTFDDITGCSKPLLDAIQIAKSFGRTDHTVVIYGETGTGKERFTHSIHNISKRGDGPFVSINCGALPENLLESELFGYVDGAFTGAQKGGRVGLVELAHQGTMFLDEIDKMPMPLQAKVLRVLQEKKVRRVGSNIITPVDVRFIAATNRNLLKLIEDGQFLVDLYFRINVLNIRIPPLRERKDDITLLMNCFCQAYSPSIPLAMFSQNAIEHFFTYDWPGNQRELENLTKRYIALKTCEIDEQDIFDHFPEFGRGINAAVPFQPEKQDDNRIHIVPGSYHNMERQMLDNLLARFGGNKTKLAEFLGISRNTIGRIVKK